MLTVKYKGPVNPPIASITVTQPKHNPTWLDEKTITVYKHEDGDIMLEGSGEYDYLKFTMGLEQKVAQELANAIYMAITGRERGNF
jgi:hypothetical protein